MFGSSIVDAALGLAFLYLLLSLLCTTIKEVIESLLNHRAKDLELGICELLREDHSSVKKAMDASADAAAKAAGESTGKKTAFLAQAAAERNKSLVARLYSHQLIYSLYSGDYKPGERRLPSYIPARSFALALMDILGSGAPNGGAKGSNHVPQSGATGATDPRFDLSKANLVGKLRDAVASKAADAEIRKMLTALVDDKTEVRLLKDLREAIAANTPDEHLRKTLTALVDAAGTSVDQARKNIEDWFNSTMDRVSGWYRRRTQWICFGIGLFLAVTINADTFAVATSLSRDQALRASVAAAAEHYAKNSPTAPEPGKKAEGVVKPKEIADQINALEGFGWPLGWGRDELIPAKDDGRAWAGKVFGWLLTAVALTLGAPFWFDVLNKFIVVRSTVKPVEKSAPEAKKDL